MKEQSKELSLSRCSKLEKVKKTLNDRGKDNFVRQRRLTDDYWLKGLRKELHVETDNRVTLVPLLKVGESSKLSVHDIHFLLLEDSKYKK
jgi:hypothetical protein